MKSDQLSTEYDWYRGNVDAAFLRADLYSDIGDFDTASQWYGVALAQSPSILDHDYIVTARTGLAMCSIERGDVSDARVQLEGLVGLVAFGDVAGQLGRVLTRLGDYREAERQLRAELN